MSSQNQAFSGEKSKEQRERCFPPQGWAVGNMGALESGDPALILRFLILLQQSDKDNKWVSHSMLILVNHGGLECCVEKDSEAQCELNGKRSCD